MKKDKQSISVIIPTFNSATYLQAALQSVLLQTRPAEEIIVIDDGSTDNSKEVVAEFKVNYFFQENKGAATARNKGAEIAQGNLLAFLDADDLWMPNKLAQQAEKLASNHSIDMVFGFVEQFISPELPEIVKNKLFCPSEAKPGYLPTTLMIRKSSWLKAESMNTSLQVGEFIDWYMKAKEKGLQSEMLPELLAKRRLHQNNQGVLKRNARVDYLRLLKARIARKREIN